MAKQATRPRVFTDGSFGAFVLDQLSALDGIAARPMFGGAGFYLAGEFFGILYEVRLYFRVSADTIKDYTSRKMKPFEPFAGKNRQSCGYYEVPLAIVESAGDLVKWAKVAQLTPLLTAKRKKARPRSTKKPPRHSAG